MAKAKAITLNDGTVLAGNEAMWKALLSYVNHTEVALEYECYIAHEHESIFPSVKEKEERLNAFVTEAFPEDVAVSSNPSSEKEEEKDERTKRREYFERPLTYSLRGIVRNAMKS